MIKKLEGVEEQDTELHAHLSVRCCKHNEDEYSISIHADDVMVTVSSMPYDYEMGCSNELTIFQLSKQNVKELAELILEQYYLIKAGK